MRSNIRHQHSYTGINTGMPARTAIGDAVQLYLYPSLPSSHHLQVQSRSSICHLMSTIFEFAITLLKNGRKTHRQQDIPMPFKTKPNARKLHVMKFRCSGHPLTLSLQSYSPPLDDIPQRLEKAKRVSVLVKQLLKRRKWQPSNPHGKISPKAVDAGVSQCWLWDSFFAQRIATTIVDRYGSLDS